MPSPPVVAFGTPRKLPKPASLPGRVVVLDLAFAADGTGSSFEKVTGSFLRALGPRLALWVDHHDHAQHELFRSDPRFVLHTKAEHGACPEIITPELVARAGEVGALVCHQDLDGLYAAAKWLRGGVEPYPGADDDARVVDTRLGVPSPLGALLDRALRARGRDEDFLRAVVRFLEEGATDPRFLAEATLAAQAFDAVEARTRALAERYTLQGLVAVCDASGAGSRDYDKTLLLLLGQERATVAVVYDEQNVTLAAPFDSGLNFLVMLGCAGGMPTVLSIPRSRLGEAFEALRAAGLYRDPPG